MMDNDNKISGWKKTGVIVQIVIMVALVISVIYTGISVNNQTEFNRNSLRPWVFPIPQDTITISDGAIKFSYNLKCIGRTPACSVLTYSWLLSDSTFPVNRIRNEKEEQLTPPSFLVSDYSLRIESYTTFDWEDLKTGEIYKQPRAKLTSDINKELFYLYFYIEYNDFNHKQYYFRITFLLKPIKYLQELSAYECRWVIVNSSFEPVD